MENARVMQAGIEHYAKLPAAIRAELYGQSIAISVLTGRFVSTKDDETLKLFADSLEPADRIWRTRVS